MSEIEQKVAECFENVFPDVPPTELPRCSQASVAAWDSLAHMTLLASISERFEIDMTRHHAIERETNAPSAREIPDQGRHEDDRA